MYGELAQALTDAYIAAEQAGIEDQALSKSINDIIIADYLGHSVSSGGRGSDGTDIDGREYEYKTTSTGVHSNFHLGSNKGSESANIQHIRSKFSGITGAYIAQMEYGVIRRVAYCPMANLLPVLEKKVRKITAGQLQPQITWKDFTDIEQSSEVPRSLNSTYPEVVTGLIRAMQCAKELEIDQGLFSKGAHNHIFLALREGHRLSEAGGGPDASDRNGKYEYKITITKDWNFHFGARKTRSENRKLIKKKCDTIAAAYLCTRRYGGLIRIIKIPAKDLQRLLFDKEDATVAGQLNLRIARNDLKHYVLHPKPDYEWMNVTELKGQLRARELSVSGKRADLIDRLIQYDLRKGGPL